MNVKVKIKTPFFAEQTNTNYMKDAEVEVPKNLADRHGEKGTGFLEVVPDKPAKGK